METLEVYLNGRKAGRLVDDNGKMSFAYLREYLEAEGREPVSFSIPLRAEAFAHDEIEAFLSNLLPDDIIRTRIADIQRTLLQVVQYASSLLVREFSVFALVACLERRAFRKE